jgi:hypothetical protein
MLFQITSYFAFCRYMFFLIILGTLLLLATVRKGDKVSEVKKITIVSLALSYFYII